MSVSRVQSSNRPATAFSSASPIRWPSVSFTALNWSRSRQCRASRRPRRAQHQGGFEILAKAQAIGRAGQCVMLMGHVHHHGFGLAALGDVLMQVVNHPSPVGWWVTVSTSCRLPVPN